MLNKLSTEEAYLILLLQKLINAMVTKCTSQCTLVQLSRVANKGHELQYHTPK